MLVSSVRGQADAVPHDLLAITGREFSVIVTPKVWIIRCIAQPPPVTDCRADYLCQCYSATRHFKGLPIPQTPKQVQGPGETSTPAPSMDLMPQSTPSSASIVDELKLCCLSRAPLFLIFWQTMPSAYRLPLILLEEQTARTMVLVRTSSRRRDCISEMMTRLLHTFSRTYHTTRIESEGLDNSVVRSTASTTVSTIYKLFSGWYM
jgi:hypothetical protein